MRISRVRLADMPITQKGHQTGKTLISGSQIYKSRKQQFPRCQCSHVTKKCLAPTFFNREFFIRLIRMAALAAVGLGCGLNAHAQRNAWPHDLPAAHSWFMCSSPNGEPMVAWVSEKKTVVAVSALREGVALPDYATPMLRQASADRRLIQPATPGYEVTIKEYGPVQTGLLKVGSVELTCSSGRDE